MNLEITDKGLNIGGVEKHPFDTLDRFKVYLDDDGRDILTIYPNSGKPDSYEVVTDFKLRDGEGLLIDNPDYYMIQWRSGMTKPDVSVRIDGRTLSGCSIDQSKEPEKKPEKKKKLTIFGGGDEHEESGE